MSFMSDYSKCLIGNESNFSVRKRIHSGKKRLKAHGNFSEFQKCIQAIISVDNQQDCEDASEKKEKILKIRKTGNNEARKENKKVEKSKFNLNLNLNSGKMSERIKRTFSVSSSEDNADQFAFNFEDFRNWDIVTVPNNFQKNFQIVNALKNLFPNPFELTKIPEFNKSKISMYFEKIVQVDVTLPDVISESDPPKMLHSTRVTKIFEADYDKNSHQMDSWTLNSTTSIKNRRSKTSEGLRSPNISDDLITNSSPRIYKNLESCRRNTSPSLQSSNENTEHESNRIERITAQDRTNFFKNGRPRTPKCSKQNTADSGVGKAQLLTEIESEDSSKDLVRKKGTVFSADFDTESDVNETSCNDKFRFSPNAVKESEKVQDILNELNQKHKVNQTEVRSRSGSLGRDKKIQTQGKSKSRKAMKNLTAEDCSKIHEDFEEANLKMSKMTNTERGERDLGRSEMTISEIEDHEMVEASEKIDEVLKFMSDCLMKLANDEVAVGGNSKKEADDVKKVRGDDRHNLANKCTEDLPTVEHPEIPETSLQSANTGRASTSTTNPSDNASQLVEFEKDADHTQSEIETVYPDSREINNENTIHIVEVQNELGGYAEEQQQTESSVENIRLSKSVLPLSVKINKSNTHNALKDALEEEEKLLCEESKLNELPSRSAFFENSFEIKTEQSQPSPLECSPLDGFKHQHSNFVVCLNSLPRKMRVGNLVGFPICPRTICFEEVQLPEIQPLPYYQDLHLEDMKLNQVHFVTEHASKVGVLFIMHRSTAIHVTTWIGVSFVMESSKMEDEVHLKKSENCVIRKFKSTKKSFHAEPSIPPITIHCAAESFKKLDLSSNLHEQIEELEEAVEQTEKVYLSEQNRNETHALSEDGTLSRDETCKTYNHESSWAEERVKRKIHDLLLRACNLQQKLHRHLQALTTKLVSVSCPSIYQELPLDIRVPCRNSEVFRIDKKSSEKCSLQKAEKSNVTKGPCKTKVQKIDCSTSYEPPPAENFEEIENQDRDDDRSSSDSFKSSNNFSEGEKEFTIRQHAGKHVQFLKNTCNQIELFKKKTLFKKEKDKKREIEAEPEDLAEISDTLKSPTKLLKTVFRGKESLTELSLGLKAVPLAEVGNISVEKRKISENHTQISICISKEHVKSLPQKRTASDELMDSRLSYYLDGIRNSMSSDRSHHSRMENNLCSPETDEEDDFKSVVSTLSRPHSETNMPNEVKEVKRIEIIPPKSLTKHRFDFYKKMDTSNKIRQKSMSNTSCTYKEFEPLQQALKEVQLRMRSIKRNSYFHNNDYYQRALKLAKMSAGYCQNCGTNSVIPHDTFGCYNTLLPRNQSHCYRSLHVNSVPHHPHPSGHYSISDHLRDVDYQQTSSYGLNSSHSIMRNPMYDFPTYSTLT